MVSAKVLVVGHRNPDNDSICSAIACAYLMNKIEERKCGCHEASLEYVPVRLGPLPPESAWLIGEYGFDTPEVISHVHARVCDVMTSNPITIEEDATIIEAGQLLRLHNIRSLVVLDAEGKYTGLVTTRMIAERFISATDLLVEGAASEMAVVADLAESLSQKVSAIMETDVLELNEQGLFKEAVEDLMASSLREAVVLDDDRHCVGIVTRTDVAVRPRRKVFLVDHNEVSQAASGITEAEVVGIIDHHRIGDVKSTNPIQFVNLPVGCTATILTMEFQRHGIEIPRNIAAALLSAIMTDTIILKSPTATATDREQVDFLAGILGVDAVEFGLRVFKCRGREADSSVDELVGADAKEFMVGDTTVLISQYETVELDAVMKREKEIREHMRSLIMTCGYEYVLFLVTDIMAEGSMFICEGNRRMVNRVFNIECTGEGGTWMPGILSRKKQVAAKILA